MTQVKVRLNWWATVSRTALFALLWWILTDGSASSWWVGAPAVVLAVTASVSLLPATPLSWYQFLRFVPYFLLRSLLGGADVAWRAFHPKMPIVPELIEYKLQLPPGLSRVFMANTVSLLPGTLSSALEQNVLKVHVLDKRTNFQAELEVLEQKVAWIFCGPVQLSAGDT